MFHTVIRVDDNVDDEVDEEIAFVSLMSLHFTQYGSQYSTSTLTYEISSVFLLFVLFADLCRSISNGT